MPTGWAPWPLKRKTRRPERAPRGDRLRAPSPSAIAARVPSNCSRSLPGPRRGAPWRREWWQGSRQRRWGQGRGLPSGGRAGAPPGHAAPARVLAESTNGIGPGRRRPLPLPPPGSLAEQARRPGSAGPLLQDQVGVGAADAEGGDPGPARLAVGLHGWPRSAARSPPPPSRPWRRARRRAGSWAARPRASPSRS